MSATPPNVPALIDRLQSVSEGGIGYSPTMTGDCFLPRGASRAGMLLLGQKPPAASETLRALVAAGAGAVPYLIAHLDDRRPTKIALTGDNGFGGIFLSQEYDANRRVARAPRVDAEKRVETYTVTVGDLCFVALGQIVNRRFNAVRYQPTALVIVNAPTASDALRKRTVDEWGGLTPAQHRARLVRDFREPDHEERRTGACVRLAFYYPEVLEPLALEQLAAPRYDVFRAEALVRDQLYPARDAATRKRLFAQFVAKYGAVAREGVRAQLIDDLSTQEADEEGRLAPPLSPKYAARACLATLFGYPTSVRSEALAQWPLDSETSQTRFVESLAGFRTPRVAEAVRRLGRTARDPDLARACARYLRS